MAERPIAGLNASVTMVAKGGREAITRIATEYAKEGTRFNTAAHAKADATAL